MTIQPMPISEQEKQVQRIGILVSDYYLVLTKAGVDKDMVDTLTHDAHNRLWSGDRYYEQRFYFNPDDDEDDKDEEG